MGNIKYIKISRNVIEKSLYACKMLSESLQSHFVIIHQFNALTYNERVKISNECLRRQEKLKLIVKAGNEDMYLTCMMVELNIVASRYNIDPATVCLCINPPCKPNERIIIK